MNAFWIGIEFINILGQFKQKNCKFIPDMEFQNFFNLLN
jgi:hypothetical protein